MGTVHVIPRGDLIEHDTDGDDCACIPRPELQRGPDGDGWVLVHHSLDGREQRETS